MHPNYLLVKVKLPSTVLSYYNLYSPLHAGYIIEWPPLMCQYQIQLWYWYPGLLIPILQILILAIYSVYIQLIFRVGEGSAAYVQFESVSQLANCNWACEKRHVITQNLAWIPCVKHKLWLDLPKWGLWVPFPLKVISQYWNTIFAFCNLYCIARYIF